MGASANMINTPGPGPNGRSAGSLNLGGYLQTPITLLARPAKAASAGIILNPAFPFCLFADHQTLKLYGEFESAVYGALKAA